MLGETEQSTRKIVNKSGFPFQLWLEEEIVASKNSHGWELTGREHHWTHPKTKRDEFIDIILSHCQLIFRVVIEAKRVQDGAWIFLQTTNSNSKTRAFSYLWNNVEEHKNPLFGWHTGYFDEEIPISSFCVTRGQNTNDQPMLERISSYILSATESLCEQESAIIGRGNSIYFPMIITTAKLFTHEFDPTLVDPETGMIDDSKFSEVPYIIFRKGFVTTHQTSKIPRNLSELNLETERSILVANSLGVIKILTAINNFRLKRNHEPLPWAPLRRK